jgi:hypothetical protein
MSQEKKKKLGCGTVLLILFGGFVSLLLIWAMVNFRGSPVAGQPMFTPSVEANHVVSPLDENGDVDYVGAINELASEGISTEENAVVKFVEAIGPAPDGTEFPSEFFERLGIESLPPEGDYFVNFHSWLTLQKVDRNSASSDNSPEGALLEESSTEEPGGLDGMMAPSTDAVDANTFKQQANEIKTNELMFEFALEHAWTAEELPIVQRWLTSCEPSMKIFSDGLKRPAYYFPMVPQSQADRALMNVVSPSVVFRDIARLFIVRSGRAMGANDFDTAFSEAMSLYRFAELKSRGATLLDELFSLSFKMMASHLVNRIVRCDAVTAEQLRRYRAELEKVGSIGGLARIVDGGERFIGLDAVQRMSRTGRLPNARQEADSPAIWARTVDYEVAMKCINRKYDELVESLDGDSIMQIQKRLDQFENEMKDQEYDLVDPWTWTKTALGGRQAKGFHVGKILSSLLLPAVSNVHVAQSRQLAMNRLLHIQIAVELFRRENDGQVPEDLDQLTPEYFQQLPVDPFTGKAFAYKVLDGGGYKVYSLGRNGIDQQEPDDAAIDAGLRNDDCIYILPEPTTWQQYLRDQFSD